MNQAGVVFEFERLILRNEMAQRVLVKRIFTAFSQNASLRTLTSSFVIHCRGVTKNVI